MAKALTDAFHVVFMVGAVLAALSFCVVLLLPERPLRTGGRASEAA